jgi:glycosyltransferase involved in cell wall biosynthesis
MATRVCAVSFKPCWRDAEGRWSTGGGFSLQMGAVASLFDAMTLVVTESEQPGTGGIPLPANAEVVAMPWPKGAGLRRRLSFLFHLPGYWKTIARHARRADCVHVPLPGDIPLIAMLVALVQRKPLIARYCGSWAATRKTTWANRVTRWLMRRFAGGRNVMLATGEGAEPPAPGLSWIFATGLTAVELAQIGPIAGRGVSRPARAAYLGRLSSEKGLDQLLDALVRLEGEGAAGPRIDLTVIGEGPQRPHLEKRIRALGWEDRVRLTGQLDRSAFGAVLQGMDFCVQPSLTEGYSKAWLDAFAYGLPVLGTRAGAAQRVIGEPGERGWLVEPGDVEMLARALIEVVTRPRDWPALRRRCRDFAEGRTLEAWAREIGRICAEQWNGRVSEGKLLWGGRPIPSVPVASAQELPHS